jgi:hypothetical protein
MVPFAVRQSKGEANVHHNSNRFDNMSNASSLVNREFEASSEAALRHDIDNIDVLCRRTPFHSAVNLEKRKRLSFAREGYDSTGIFKRLDWAVGVLAKPLKNRV